MEAEITPVLLGTFRVDRFHEIGIREADPAGGDRVTGGDILRLPDPFRCNTDLPKRPDVMQL